MSTREDRELDQLDKIYCLEKKIMVRTSFRGTHSWPEASTFAGDDVKFLEVEHRHTFHIKAELYVTESDREVEFFIFQRQVDTAIRKLYMSLESVGKAAFSMQPDLFFALGRRSCETIAEEIITELRVEHDYAGKIAVEVWEDNEVGGRVVSAPQQMD